MYIYRKGRQSKDSSLPTTNTSFPTFDQGKSYSSCLTDPTFCNTTAHQQGQNESTGKAFTLGGEKSAHFFLLSRKEKLHAAVNRTLVCT